jgi:hypothetical protein
LNFGLAKKGNAPPLAEAAIPHKSRHRRIADGQTSEIRLSLIAIVACKHQKKDKETLVQIR